MKVDLANLWEWLRANARDDLPEAFAPLDGAGVPEYDDGTDECGEIDYGDAAVQLMPLAFIDAPAPDEALVHFTHDAEAVAALGLLGTRDPARLGLTLESQKREPGYNFAFQALSDEAAQASRGRPDGMYYGDVAYVFHAPHILVRHRGDAEEQAIFLGSDLDAVAVPTVRYVETSSDDYDDEEGPPVWAVHAPGSDTPSFGPATWREAVAEAVRLLNDCTATPSPR